MNTRRWILLSALLLAGCGAEEFQDLQEFVNQSGADMRGKIEAPPEVKPYEPFTYDNSENLPDPFKPRKPERQGSGKSGLSPELINHKPEELEEFPLDSLKMTGFVFIHDTAYAVISAPDGKVHNVRVGNYMGQNFGRVISITETELKLKEMIQDSAGDWSERISSLELIE